MKIDGINHRIGIKAPVEKVYEALATAKGITRWWGPAKSDGKVGSKLEIDFAPRGTMELKIVDLEANKQVSWESMSYPPHWSGTRINFSLRTEGDYTVILFSHKGWKDENFEMAAHSSTKWATFLLSLKSLLEEGKGLPSPNDRKIDNWN